MSLYLSQVWLRFIGEQLDVPARLRQDLLGTFRPFDQNDLALIAKLTPTELPNLLS